MLHQPTIEKLLAMRMEPMVEAWRGFEQDENAHTLSFEDKLSLMVDRLWTHRQNVALERRLRYAKLRGNACVEDIDYRAARGLNRAAMRALATDSSWVATSRERVHRRLHGPGQKLLGLRPGAESLPGRVSGCCTRGPQPCSATWR